MPKYNKSFELSIEDLAQIEESIRLRQAQLCAERRQACDQTRNAIEADLRSGEDLLGRLHQQKIFYRPANQPYVGG